VPFWLSSSYAIIATTAHEIRSSTGIIFCGALGWRGKCSVASSFDAFVLGAFFSSIYLLHESQPTVRLYLHTQERTPIWGITQCHLARASNKPLGIFTNFSLVVREILLCSVVFGALPALPMCLPSFLDRGFIYFICHSASGECLAIGSSENQGNVDHFELQHNHSAIQGSWPRRSVLYQGAIPDSEPNSRQALCPSSNSIHHLQCICYTICSCCLWHSSPRLALLHRLFSRRPR
jgi:hypothetical protein